MMQMIAKSLGIDVEDRDQRQVNMQNHENYRNTLGPEGEDRSLL
jgi:hypothetical protein